MLLGWLVRLLIVVLLVRAVWSFVSGFLAGASGPARVRPRKSMALVRDPVCGTYVEKSRALSKKTGEKVHYFCSENCRSVFNSDI
jgi:YHS domain-containing protein